MNKLRQSLRRKKPCYVPEASRPHQWQSDEETVRKGKCSFPVRYLGHVEVDESRGMHVCEEAVKKLKTIGKKSVKAVLWVSADGLRVVDDKTKVVSLQDLILDQTIEKVSFCAPDRNYDKAFSYICRDGTTRRWICHCFMALKDSGERLSHAVGCAFAACLERKQKREKECGVTASFDASRTSFAREGSFRVTSATQQAEREEVMKQLQDRKKVESPSLPADSASPRGLVSVDRTEAGTSTPSRAPCSHRAARAPGLLPGFPAQPEELPFKRQLSLRLNELPSTLQRKTDFQAKNPGKLPEMESGPPNEADSINTLYCQINSSFSKPPEEPFTTTITTNGIPPPSIPARVPAGPAGWAGDVAGQSPPACQMGHKRTPSEAERWLEEVAQAVKAQQQQPQQQQPPTMLAALPGTPVSIPNAMQPFPLAFDSTPAPVGMFVPPPLQPSYMPMPTYMPALANSMSYPSVPVVGITPSQMVANVFCTATQNQGTGLAAGKMGSIGGLPQSFNSPASVAVITTSSSNHTSSPITVNGIPPNSQNCTSNSTSNGTAWPPGLKQLALAGGAQEVDQFEVQWAALESKSQQRASNPFSNELQKTFEIEL
ncbi:numb-like protein isoform X1 [Acipenser oxyrinchus oxyrinchus]|uniref:Numb-like protein isoform X1 n=1 Tax=Acipenser oxyrinchus oxyrinchus TaxID=40147 RepID=A0AAD8CNW3_ACIOX|nr:numb-like protein isoform X1 [Acipenser oxyrinchus oxyrinchus]